MAKFFVGQRVRVVACDDLSWAHVIGSEGFVNELDCTNMDDEPGNVGVTIGGDDGFCFWPWELEPATDANDKIEWSECIWAPEHLRETV